MSREHWAEDAEPYLRPVATGEPGAWQQEAQQHGHRGEQQLTEVGEVVPPARVARALRISGGTPVVVRRRIISLDGKATELTDSYYPAHIARGTALAEPRKIRGGAVTLLAELGYVGHARHEEVMAREPSDGERTALALDDNEWVLDVCRLVVNADDEPFEVTTMTMPARGRTLHYIAKIG
ncbi:UTRA domain-containing protein [Kitasatospora sp. NBC_01287]|uniref:UTRA domain-containing protein n=1 Tax=Kitasatospora sp. NBC_01287 TaxID=2903573 RepID=UPI00225138AC|nr:UTRA domain-containing protein [Kitasatospora sp. NBC_01287]MCX4750941.1 UTRA domain-containing protein [Kitasatospora sp. NBC_01287]MCX4751808.1 UTRA domain-containing protein [Kitasatospora sp. NBC_01287]MCX4751900.1 UTRA domain-containing protein [Kitasatospora sp. NBC_01287]